MIDAILAALVLSLFFLPIWGGALLFELLEYLDRRDEQRRRNE